MAEFDFDGGSCQIISSKRSGRSFSSKSSNTFQFSLTQEKESQDLIATLPHTSNDDDASKSSRRNQVSSIDQQQQQLQQQQQNDEINQPDRHVRFSLSAETQDSSSLDPSLRRVMESSASAASSTSSNNARASCLRKNTYSVSKFSSQIIHSSSIESHASSNASVGSNSLLVGSKSRGMSSMILTKKSGRRRLNYSSGLNSTENSASRPLENNVSVDEKMPMRQEAKECHKSLDEESAETRPVRGAGANVFAIQDAGTQQMLTDECGYLCSTILSSPVLSGETSRVTNVNPQRVVKALETAYCDLALLVSTHKTRCALWGDGRTSKAGSMLNVLNVVGSLNSPQLQAPPIVSCLVTTTNTKPEEAMDDKINSQESLTSLDADQSNAATETAQTSIPESLMSAMAALLHFLSWDCTLSEHSAAQYKYGRRSNRNVATMAQRIRRHLLQHPNAMQAIGRLIVDDPFTRQILRPSCSLEQGEEGEMMIVEPTSQESVMSDISVDVTQDFIPLGLQVPNECNDQNPNDAVSVNSRSSEASVSSEDPTAAGRRRRKRKRLLGTSELEPIVEEREDDVGPNGQNEQGSAMSPPRKRVYGGAARESSPSGKMSFTSRESPSRSPIIGGRDDDEQSRASMANVQIQENLVKIHSKLIQPENERATTRHCCRTEASALESPACIALHALNRIIAGKEGDEESCLDHDDHDASQSQSLTEDDEDETNPLLVTNRLLGESGILPYLARGLAESIQAVVCLIQQPSTERGICPGCLADLHERVSVLANLIDGSCCLHAANRRTCCDREQEGLLIGSLILLFHSTSNLRESNEWKHLTDENKLNVSDILLVATRVLTSLTHENELAAQQLLICHRFLLPCIDSLAGIREPDQELAIFGLDVLARLCYLATQWRAQQATDKHTYDVIIFCLNTLSNTMDFENVRLSILEASVPDAGLAMPDSNQNICFFSWLARWLVSETSAFRDIIVKGTFGAQASKAVESRDLQKDEEESLVVAGHGMVVLACAMTTARSDANTKHLARVLDLVTKEMPLTEDAAPGLLLVKNTLKAFCNFYRFSIGELSVAVVEPVRGLLAKLDEVQKGQ